jgi:DNA (cytosine-5)-methyltransferase 1
MLSFKAVYVMGTVAQDIPLDQSLSGPVTAERLAFYDFFAGVGLAGLGLGEAWRCLWANDFDPGKAEIYEKNFGRGSILVKDVSTVSAPNLPGNPDLAWASFPCQDLSLAGWQRGMTAKRSGAFWEFWRIIRELQAHVRNPRILVPAS